MADAPPLDAGSLIGVTFGVTRSSSMSNLNRTLGPATARVSALAHRGADLGRLVGQIFFGFWREATKTRLTILGARARATAVPAGVLGCAGRRPDRGGKYPATRSRARRIRGTRPTGPKDGGPGAATPPRPRWRCADDESRTTTRSGRVRVRRPRGPPPAVRPRGRPQGTTRRPPR